MCSVASLRSSSRARNPHGDACVVAAEGFVHEAEAPAAIDALATAGIIESATIEAAIAEAKDTLAEQPAEPPPPGPD